MILGTWAILLLNIVFSFLQALSVVISAVFFQGEGRISREKEEARENVTQTLELAAEWMDALVDLLTKGMQHLLTVFLSFFAFILLAAALNITYQYSPSVLGEATKGWNESVGVVWDAYIMQGLRALQTVFSEVVGVYNLLVFFLLKLPANLGLHMLAGGYTDLAAAANKLALVAPALRNSATGWYEASTADCPGLVAGAYNTSCYNPELRQFDLANPLIHVADAMSHVVEFFPRRCAVIEQPLIVLAYPLTDHDLAYALHYYVNVFNQFVQSIVIAVNRFGTIPRLAFVLPDLAPVFNNVVYGNIHLGRAVDNWLNMVYFMVNSFIAPDEAFECERTDGSWNFTSRPTLGVFGNNHTVVTSLTPTVFAITDGTHVEYHYHGVRPRTTTSLDAWPIPVNTSYGIAAVSYARDMSRSSVGNGETTALFGCMCTDDFLEGIQLTCAVVPFESLEGVQQAAFITNITWEVANTPKRMSCRKTKINIESLRYVPQQFTSPSEFSHIPNFDPPVSCLERGSCTKIDAAIWVMPVCTIGHDEKFSSVGGDSACMRSLKDFSCWPFCLGVRRSFSANERIVVRSSSAWENNVVLTARDCALESASVDKTTTRERTSASILDEDENAKGVWMPHSSAPDVPVLKIKAPDTDDSTACNLNENAVSSVPLLLEQKRTSSAMFIELSKSLYGEGWEHADTSASDFYRSDAVTDSMLLEHQPFVFAGGYAMRSITTCEGKLWDDDDRENTCTTVLDILQITGNEFNEFRLKHVVPFGFPVTPRPTVLRQTDSVLQPGMVTLPPVVVRSPFLHNPATTTRDFIWYAVNPDYENVHCILRYCRQIPGMPNCMQFSVLSNYDRLRIWRVVPYAGCEMTPGGPVCPAYSALSVTFRDQYSDPIPTSAEFDFEEFCDESKHFNFYITTMENFDPLNILVTVRRGNRQGLYDELYGPEPNALTAPEAYTVSYFIHTETMEVRETVPWVNAPLAPDGVVRICDNMRIMPELGSAVAEMGNSVIHLVKMVVGSLVASGALAEAYAKPYERCNLVGLRHSAYDECVTKVFDLTDMFTSIHHANLHLWGVIDFISLILERSADGDAANIITTFLGGVRMSQEDRLILSKTSITSGFMQMANTGANKFVAQGGTLNSLSIRHVVTGVGSPAFMSGMNVGIAGVMMAEFTYRTMIRIVDMLLILAHTGGVPGTDTGDGDINTERIGGIERASGGLMAKYVGGNISTILYESIRTDWDDLVMMRARRVCSGISLMMGYTNPWARVLRHWCLSGVEMTDGMMQAFATLTVEVPFNFCVCTRSIGHDFTSFMTDVCIPETAPSIAPMALALLAWENDITQLGKFEARDLMQYMCEESGNQYQVKLHSTFDGWAEQHLRAADATMELLDYLGVLAGKVDEECSDLENNPSVAVIVPQPLDIFRICGVTQTCQSYCRPYKELLDEEIAKRNGVATAPRLKFTAPIESPMFDRSPTRVQNDRYLRLLAFMELDGGSHADCPCPLPNTDCVSVAGIPYGNYGDPSTEIAIRSYCIPAVVNERMFKISEWTLNEQSTGYPIHDYLNMDTASRLMRIAYSVPHGDHIIMLSRSYGQTASSTTTDLEFSTSFEQITATRSWSGLGTKLITSGPNLADVCRAPIQNAITPFVEQDLGTGIEEYDTKIERVKILDFLNVVSDEFTIDLMLKLDVTTSFVEKAAPEVRAIETVYTVYLRVGWCEYVPANYPGPRRTTPTACVGITVSDYQCSELGIAFGSEMFSTWLRTGSFVYLPKYERYMWVPQRRVPGSIKYNGLHFANLTLAGRGVVTVEEEDESLAGDVLNRGSGAYYLSNSLQTNQVLGGLAYLANTDSGINPTSHTAVRRSSVGHRRNYDPNTYRTESLWYAAGSNIITRSWLHDIRYEASSATLRGVPSREHNINIEVDRYCNGHSCQGCATLKLKQICTNYQMCLTTRCIGTIVNHDSMLCDMGMMIESFYVQSVSIWLSGWHAMATIMISVLQTTQDAQGGVGGYVDNMHATWLSDLFYTSICEGKNILARMTAIVATLMHKGLRLPSNEDRPPTGTASGSIARYTAQNTGVVNEEAYSNTPLQIAATHQMLFQMSLAPNYAAVAFYRWFVCLVEDSVSILVSGTDTTVVFRIDNHSADAGVTWGACSTAQNVEQIMQASSIQGSLDSLVAVINDVYEDEGAAADLTTTVGVDPIALAISDGESAWIDDDTFADDDEDDDDDDEDDEDDDDDKKKKKAKKKKQSKGRGTSKSKGGGSNPLSRIRPLNLILQVFDAAIAWATGVITGMQDVIYNNDNPWCQVQDVTAADAVNCSCGDSPAWINRVHRRQTVDDGALWCTGVLYVAANDGTFVHVYNPYSLHELSEKTVGMEEYLECVSSSQTFEGGCPRPHIQYFENQGINTFTIIARCRNNYAQKQWDAGAFALFRDDFEPPQEVVGISFASFRTRALAWAESVGPELYTCVTENEDPNEFGECLQVYLRTVKIVHNEADGIETTGVREDTYWAYESEKDPENLLTSPDSCMLFTGPSQYAGSEDSRAMFSACLEEADYLELAGGSSAIPQLRECALPLVAWSGNLRGRVPIGTVHRDAIEDEDKRIRIANRTYHRVQSDVNRAFDEFDETAFGDLDALFFSAEGDAVHQFFDCMFMGPYAKVDYLIGDPDGLLKTIQWYRDNATGTTREFDLPCAGDKLNGDTKSTPFTCGSPSRRSVIKYYIRDILFNQTTASNRTAEIIKKRLGVLRESWTNISNYGCRSPDDGSISFKNCGDPLKGGVGWSPSVKDFGHVESQEVAEEVFRYMRAYYRQVMTDTTPWYKYYLDTENTEYWGDWKGTPESKEFHLFEPFKPVVSYSNTEGFDSVNGSTLRHSMWGVCTSLLGQPYSTVPLVKYTNDGVPNVNGSDDAEREIPAWMPRFIRETMSTPYDPVPEDPNDVFQWMQDLLEEAWEHSPMFMHYAAKYVPSLSMLCESAVSDTTSPDYDDPNVDYTRVEFSKRATMFFDEVVVPGESEEEVLWEFAENVPIPVHGYQRNALGSVLRTCPCGSKVTHRAPLASGFSTGFKCKLSSAVCSVIQSNLEISVNSTQMLAACRDEGGEYSSVLIPTILKELEAYGGVPLPCPDRQMSDQWGFFPYDEMDENANEYWRFKENDQFQDTSYLFDSMNLLAHRRSGITPANLEYVRESAKAGNVAGHNQRRGPIVKSTIHSVSQSHCSNDRGDILPRTDEKNLVDDFVEWLFPVAQVVYDAPGSSACIRYMLEYVKLKFAKETLRLNDVQRWDQSVARWKERCDIKTKQMTVCNAMGIFDIVPLQNKWRAELPADCNFPLSDEFEEKYSGTYYITPACILYLDGTLYNLHRCRKYGGGETDSFPITLSHLVPECRLYDLGVARAEWSEISNGDGAMQSNPRAMSYPTTGSPLSWGDGSQFGGDEYYHTIVNDINARQKVVRETSIGVDMNRNWVHAIFGNDLHTGVADFWQNVMVSSNTDPNTCPEGDMYCEKGEFCDKTFDYWPELWSTPYGYHPTTTCMAEDNAYRTFDSYLSMDRDEMQTSYEHSSLRSAKHFSRFLGAGGTCRLHNVRMPMLETNTHRVCTRFRTDGINPVNHKNRRFPTPGGLPSDDPADLDTWYTEERCGQHSTDVPWDSTGFDHSRPHEQWNVGGIPDFLRATRPVGFGRAVNSPTYPLTSTLSPEEYDPLESILETDKYKPLMARSGVAVDESSESPWGPCTPPLYPAACTVDPDDCPVQSVCRHVPGMDDNRGVCLREKIVDSVRMLPCFRSDMCPENEYCLAEGYCGRVKFHVWNMGDEAVEFTRLHENTCGTDTDPAHPFTQDFAGASPWETVPDILRGHGMCAQRHQYAYRYAMAHRTEEEDDPNVLDPEYAYFAQRTDGDPRFYVWPWVQQTPSGKILDETEHVDPNTEQDRRFMHMYPHPCDRNYMHTENVKVCSGIKGDEQIDVPYYKIQLEQLSDSNAATWSVENWKTSSEPGGRLNTTHWMRTREQYRNGTERMVVSNVFNTDDYMDRGGFAFLGGDVRDPDTTFEGSTGRSNTRFLKCINVELCGMPQYTYNGNYVDRGMFMDQYDLASWRLQEESDVTQCGSLGFAMSATECRMDLTLFPLLRLLITTSENPCTRIYGSIDGGWIDAVRFETSMPAQCSPPNAICCTGEDEDLWCKYAAITRTPTVGSTLMSITAYEALIDKLNNIHALGTVPIDIIARRTSIDVAADLGECLELVHTVNQRYQREHYTVKYRRPADDADGSIDNAPAGLYHIMRYHLYEVPWLWYFKYAYKTLVWNPNPPNPGTALLNFGTIQHEGGTMSIGEAWSSRVSVSTNSWEVLECNSGANCKCSRSEAEIASNGGSPLKFKDRLLCVNAAPSRLLAAEVLGNAAAQESLGRQFRMVELKNAFVERIRTGMKMNVRRWLRQEFGFKLGTVDNNAGCFSEAHWNREACQNSRECVESVTAISMDINTIQLDPFADKDMFVFRNFQRGRAFEDVDVLIAKIVESIDFIDESFLELEAVVQAQDPLNLAPLMKILDTVVFNEITDWADINPATSYIAYDPSDTEIAFGQCLFPGLNVAADFENQAYHSMTGNLKAGNEALVTFGNGNGDFYSIDVCAHGDDSKHETYERNSRPDVPGLTGSFKRMSCSFQDEVEERGRDFCDADGSARFPIQRGFLGKWEGRAMVKDPVWDVYEYGMDCTHAEWIQTLCIDTGITKAYQGRFQGTWQFIDSYAWFDGGVTCPVEAQKNSLIRKQCILPEPYIQKCQGYDQYQPCNVDCPATIQSTRELNGGGYEHARGGVPESKFVKQGQSSRNICHRIDQECWDNSGGNFLGEPAPGKIGNCKIQTATMPPGVAAKFFVSDSHPESIGNPLAGDGREWGPQWFYCPEIESGASADGVYVGRNQKALTWNYKSSTATGNVKDCTKQPSHLPNRGFCSENPDIGWEDTCYVVDGTEESTWRIEDTIGDGCSLYEGACFYSLSLASGFRCVDPVDSVGSGIEDAGSTCPFRMFSIRAPAGKRGLYQCKPCTRYHSKAFFDGEFSCGYKPENPENGFEGASRADLITMIQNYLQEQLRTDKTAEKYAMQYIRDLQERYPDDIFFGNSKDSNLPIMFENNNIFYIELQPLSFASSFAQWGPNPNACRSGLAVVHTEKQGVHTCPWTGGYDATAIGEVDHYYHNRISALRCAVESPKPSEYGKCSDSGTDAPRHMLRSWVDKHYRKRMGTWLHVLPPQSGAVFDGDKSGTEQPFTLFFAEHSRNPDQVHTKFVLGNTVCADGTRTHAVCAASGVGATERVDLVNPWMGCEFNPWLYDEANHGMGLDQCYRETGNWEVCCSCTPVSRCCYPAESCPDGKAIDPSDTNERYTANYFTSGDHDVQCKQKDYQPPPGEGIPHSENINVCLRDALRHHPDVCTHYQGIIGGGASSPIKTLQNLYHETATESIHDVEPFLVAPEIVLWRGELTSASLKQTTQRFMSMPRDLLYPAHIVWNVPGEPRIARLNAMQFVHNSGRLYDNQVPIRARDWVSNLRENFALDHPVVQRLYPSLGKDPSTYTDGDWSCPLRSIAFYGRDTPGFNPLIPDPIQSNFMFGKRFYCIDGQADQVTGECIYGIHPYHKPEEYTGLRDYYTSDGTCFYDPHTPLQTGIDTRAAQQKLHTDRTAACGLRGHIKRALMGEAGTSHAATLPATDCIRTLDWGDQPLEYRNSEASSIEQETESQSCGVLGRVEPFVIRFKSDAPILLDTQETTEDVGGDCHMGRATVLDAGSRAEMSEYELCLTVGRTASQAHIRCSGRRRSLAADTNPPTPHQRATTPDRIFVFEREIRMHPENIITGADPRHQQTYNRTDIGEDITAPKPRARCSECDAHTIPTKGPGHSKLTYPENSVGKIHRMSSERMMAAEIARMCVESPTCNMQADGWREEEFLRILTTDPESLVDLSFDPNDNTFEKTTLKTDLDALPPPVDDSALWDYPWVLYASDGTALGSITREDWLQDRYGTCKEKILQEVENDDTGTFVRPISICDVTGPLSTLCEQLSAAQVDLRDANCIAQGTDCEILETYYSPSQWSPTNKAFARETVRDFYKYYADDACVGEADRVLAAEKENALVQADCGATLLERVKQGLQISRLAVRVILAAVIAFETIILDLTLMLFAAIPTISIYNDPTRDDMTILLEDIMRHVETLFRLLKEAIMQSLNLVIHLLERSPIGSGIASAFQTICTAVTWIFEIVVKGLLCNIFKFVVNNLVIKIVDGLESFLSDLNPFGSVKFPGWEEARSTLRGFADSLGCTSLEAAGQGIADGSIGCTFDSMEEGAQAPTEAFVATRCWANPSFGDLIGEANALGCTSSDTCIYDDIGGENVVCERCPSVDVNSFMRYGCDVAVKRCKCSTPIQYRTQCIRNSDCRASVPCRTLTDPDSPSFGTTDCLTECSTEPICLIDDAATSDGTPPIGECTCMLTPPRIETCDSGGGYVPTYPTAGVCMFARDRSLADTITINTQNILEMSSLAVTPCPLLSRSRSHLTCQRVRTATGALTNTLVGTQILKIFTAGGGRRRSLLWEEDEVNRNLSYAWEPWVPYLTYEVPIETWENTGMCYELIHAARSVISSSMLSVTDRYYLQECAKWRAVMLVTIGTYNITDVTETTLLSYTQITDAVVKHVQKALFTPSQSMLASPVAYTEAVAYIFSQMGHTETTVRTLRTLYYSVRRWWRAITLLMKRNAENIMEQSKWQSFFKNNTVPTINVSLPPLHQAPVIPRRVVSTKPRSPLLSDQNNTATSPQRRGVFLDSMEYSHAGRKLMQSRFWDDPARFRWDWSVDWESMRSQWEEHDSEPVCELWDIARESSITMWESTVAYYDPEQPRAARTEQNWNFSGSAMKLPQPPVEDVFARNPPNPSEGFSAALINGLVDTVEGFIGFGKRNISAFFDPRIPLQEQQENDLFTFPRLLNDMTTCNHRALMLCDTQPRSLLVSAVMTGMIIMIFCRMFSLSWGTTTILTVTLFPWGVMWYAYAYSPFCFPMIPTCFLGDLINALDAAVPSRIEWPVYLIHQEHCTLEAVPRNTSLPPPNGCIKSCSSAEFQFKSWIDPFGWFMCEYDPEYCKTTAEWVTKLGVFGRDFENTVNYFLSVREFNDENLSNAHQMCAWLTGFYIIPVALAAVWGVLMVLALIKATITIMLKTLLFMVKRRGMEEPTSEEDALSDADDAIASRDMDE